MSTEEIRRYSSWLVAPTRFHNLDVIVRTHAVNLSINLLMTHSSVFCNYHSRTLPVILIMLLAVTDNRGSGFDFPF